MTMSSPGSSCLVLLALVVSIQAIDYAAYRHDAIPRSVAKLTTRSLLETINDVKHRKTSYTLQESTESFLQYGALLRSQILDTFGKLVYVHYDDFSMMEVEALYRVYQETLERKYNIFEIAPAVLTDPDIRPSKICSHIHDYVHTCLKESTVLCMDIQKHDDPHPQSYTSRAREVILHIYRTGKIARLYPKGFSLPIVLKYLKKAKLQLTPALISGLLHNVRYDIFDDEVRSSERELLHYLSGPNARKSPQGQMVDPPTLLELRSVHTIGSLLKLYLKTRKTHFPAKIRRDAEFLAEHIVGDVDSVSENIQLLGNVYENGTIRVDYLLGLVVASDLVDPDIVAARDYLVDKLESLNIVDKYLNIDKYLQASPDQLAMEMVGQLREIEFATDIATALRAHARFWHRSHMVENLNDLLELFDAYENLRHVPKYGTIMRSIDRIKENLWDSRNVSVELLCNSPRACLQMGLQVVMRCTHVNKDTKDQIAEFLKAVTPKGSLVEDECALPMSQNVTVRPDTRKTTIPSTIVASKTSPPSSSDVTENPYSGMTTTVGTTDRKTNPSTLTTTSESESSSMEIDSTSVPDLASGNGHSGEGSMEDGDRTPGHSSIETGRSRSTTPWPNTDDTSAEETIPTGHGAGGKDGSIPWTTDLESSSPHPLGMGTMTTSGPNMPPSSSACKTEGCTDEEDSDETLSSAILPTTTPIPTLGSGKTDPWHSTYPPGTSGDHPGASGSHPGEDCSGEDCEKVCEEGEDCSAAQCSGEGCEKACEEGEDCSTGQCSGEGCQKTCGEGEDCSAIDCSGEDCPRKTSEDCSEEDEDCQAEGSVDGGAGKCDSDEASCVSSADCSGEDCPAVSTTDTGDDCSEGHCKTDSADKSGTCVGEDCKKSPADGSKGGDCQGEDCPSAEDCENNDCVTKSKDETSCEGPNCSTGDSEASTITESSKNGNGSSVYCDNKDPNYQRKLSRLQKMMKISALRAAQLLAGKNASQESSSDEHSRTSESTSVFKDFEDSDDDSYTVSAVNKPSMKRVKLSGGLEVFKGLGQGKSVKYPSYQSDIDSSEEWQTKKSSSPTKKIQIGYSPDSSSSSSSTTHLHPKIHVSKAKTTKTTSGKKPMRHVEKSAKISAVPTGKVKVKSSEEAHKKPTKHNSKRISLTSLPSDYTKKVSVMKSGKMSRHNSRSTEESSEATKMHTTKMKVNVHSGSKKRAQPRYKSVSFRFGELVKNTPAVYQSQTEKPGPTRASRSILRRPPRREYRARF